MAYREPDIVVRRLVMEARHGLGNIPGAASLLAYDKAVNSNEMQGKAYRDKSILHLAGAARHTFTSGLGIPIGMPYNAGHSTIPWGISAESDAWQLLRPPTRMQR